LYRLGTGDELMKWDFTTIASWQ